MTQVAVLMVFQPYVSEERVRQIADDWTRSMRNPSEEPSVASTQEFDLSDGEPIIYQPQDEHLGD